MWNNVDPRFSRNMTGKNSSTEYCLIIIVATIFSLISSCTPIISDKRLCYDPDCSVAIGTAKTLSTYRSNDPRILSFGINEDVEIFSKGAGLRKDLWGVEIAGKRGYAPSMFLKEKKTIHKVLEYEVPTPEYEYLVPETLVDVHKIDDTGVDGSGIDEGTIESEVKSLNELTINNSIQPTSQQVSPSYEVIDGTTLNVFPKEGIINENNYATEVVHGTASIIKPLPLTVHQNLESSEIRVEKNISDETTILPFRVSDQPSEQSVFSHIVSEELNNVISNEENRYLYPPENEQVVHSIVDELTTIDEKRQKPVEIHENVEILSGNKEQDPQIDLNKGLDLEFTENIISTNSTQLKNLNNDRVQTEDDSALLVKIPEQEPTEESYHVTQSHQSSSTDGTQLTNNNDKVEIENDSTLPVKILEQELTEESLHVTQPYQSSPIIDEENEQMVTEANSNTISDPIPNVQAETFDTVTELSNNLLVTTEIPITSYNIHESTQASTSMIPEVVNDDIAIMNEVVTGIPDEKIKEVINQGHQDGADYNTLDTTRTSENTITDKNDKLPANAPDNSDYSDDQQLLLQENHPDIREEIEPPGLSPEIDSDHVLNFNDFSVNQDFQNILPEDNVRPSDVCYDDTCNNDDGNTEEVTEEIKDDDEISIDDTDTEIIHTVEYSQNYYETFSYLALTAFTTLLFSLGYYYIENTRRDGQLIAKINKLEKELLISSKECTVLDDSLKSTKTKLNSIEDQSFGSNEMVVSLKKELETAYKAKLELEEQVTTLEKDLESAAEAGLELERMLREILASNNAENSLAKSVADLQTRLNTQQSANASLTTALQQKAQEGEALSHKLTTIQQKCEQLEIEVTRKDDELKQIIETKNNMEQSFLQKIEQLENQAKNISADQIRLRKQLKGKEIEISDLLEVVKQVNTSGIDLEKITDVSRIKANANQWLEEKEELQSKLGELEGAYHLLEEHMKIVNEEMKSLSKQCQIAEKEKNDAETRLQVLSKFFKEKEEERQKEEAIWLQQQGEVSMNAERLLTVNNEIQSYKQQIETLKREILDQEREYKNQITNLESKSHEQWVLARQSERRLEEAKAEAAQLRNRLTMIEKNLSDNDSEVKTHRLETNGETATSPTLFIGPESSSSPIMFAGSSNIPSPYLYGPPLPPFLPPHLHSSSGMQGGFDVGQRPPPLGGRLSSPPPMPISSGGPPPPIPPPLHPSSSTRYENSRSSPSPPLSPSMLPPYGHFRSHPPPPLPFPNDRVHPPPPMHIPTMLLPHLSNTPWGEEKISPRNNSSFHPFHRDQQPRDYTGSLVSSDESLDKTHKSGKV